MGVGEENGKESRVMMVGWLTVQAEIVPSTSGGLLGQSRECGNGGR
jgi:hypothetical protein